MLNMINSYTEQKGNNFNILLKNLIRLEWHHTNLRTNQEGI